jgi:DNA-binding transcriptional MerR regulator
MSTPTQEELRLYALEDAAKTCGIAPEMVLKFVSAEWITPVDRDRRLFDEEDLARLRLIHEITERFEVNASAVPVILHLIDQLNRLHLEIHSLTPSSKTSPY